MASQPADDWRAWQDIFLRELISNAADACDKKRFLSLTEEGSSSYDGRVRLVADKEANTLTIEDNGIGMTRADLKNNLGKIAQSGAARTQARPKHACRPARLQTRTPTPRWSPGGLSVAVAL